MPSDYYHNIRRRFVIGVVVMLLILAGVFYWYAARERQLVVLSAEKNSASYVSALKEHAERVFAEADNTLNDLQHELDEHGGLSYSQSPQFFKFLGQRATNFSSVYIVDAKADIIAHSQEYRMKPVNLADRDYFLHHRDNPASGLFISKPFKSKVSNTWRFSLSRSLRDAQGGFLGLVSVTFETDYFEKFYKTIDVGKRGRIILATTDGEILVLEPRYEKKFAQDFKTSILFSSYLKSSPDGTHHVLSPISNEMKIMSYKMLTNVPVVAIVSYDQGEVTATWLAAIYKQSAIGSVLALLFALLSNLFLKQVRKLGQVNIRLEQQLVLGLKAEHREQVRAGILERIAGGEPLPQQLSFIALSIEKENPEMLCSILLVSDDGKRLISGAAPSLPDFYNMAAHRTRIAEGVGSCGTASFRRERVIVEDIDSHPFWKGFTPAQEAGLRSCWSEPILSSAGELLGTFAIYHRTPAIPGEEEISLIQQASAFAAIAIERSRNETERNELENSLNQSQKMEAIGHLAGGVAHDFNNLLTPIIVYADMLKRAQPDEKLLPKIEGIIKASHKARDLTQQLLSFGRKQVMQMQILDLNEVMTSFYSILRRTLRESIDINLLLSSQAAVIRADRSKLDQIILNLAINAQDSISDTGQITIETGRVMIDDEYARLHPGMKSGDFVLLSFKDTGCGMSAETMEHIFEPFFTTKQVGHGTGLGLANVYGIVKQHDGYIAVDSTPGAGTLFKIYFSLSAANPDDSAVFQDVCATDHAGFETILLVEDNEMVRVMITDLLEGLGYRVYSEGHPERALELIRQIPDKIDLLITDVVMPGMNGLQLFERINAERPEINRVLYMSGYTNNVIVTDGTLAEGLHFLQKPFTVDALMNKIKHLLRPVD